LTEAVRHDHQRRRAQAFDVELHTPEVPDVDAQRHALPLFDDNVAVGHDELTVGRLNREPNGFRLGYGLHLASPLSVHQKPSSPAAPATGWSIQNPPDVVGNVLLNVRVAYHVSSTFSGGIRQLKWLVASKVALSTR